MRCAIVRLPTIEVRTIFTLSGAIARLDSRLRLWSLIAWCVAWLVVAWAMLDPSPPPVDIVSDKVIHFASFVVVSFAALAFCRSDRQLAAAGMLCAVAGVGLEIGQYFVPSRVFEWGDMAANLGGTVLGILLAALVLRGLRWLGWPPESRRAARSAV
jgi:VanZ family protein